MKLFNTIAIEINSLCNRKCSFCPNNYHQRPNEFMEISLIEKIVKELKELNYNSRIELTLYNEPLIDKRITEISKYIKTNLPKTRICLFSNGDLIKNEEDIKILLNSGITDIEFNCYEINRYNFILELVRNIKGKFEFSKEQNIYKNKNKLNITVINKSIPENLSGIHKITNRAGLIKTKNTNFPLKKTCTRPFRTFSINWKGEVILCCQDYFGKVIMGNLYKEKIFDIWKNEKYEIYRKELLKNSRNLELCNICDFNGGYYTHLLKNNWKELCQ